jgi:hypothetical protein
MRHNASDSLHPSLQKALSCLDIRLEEELARYRRKRTGQIAPPVILPPKAKKVEQSPTNSAPALPSFGNSLNPPKVLSADIPASNESMELAPYPAEPEDDSEPIYHSAPEAETPPEDYLESSEELLRSLAREEAKVQVERSFLEYLSTPLGIGSMMVLLLSSAMFGYIIMNPSSLKGMGSLFAQQEAEQAVPQATSNESAYPPVDSQEFVDLGLNNLTALQSRPRNAIPVPGVPSVSPSPSPTVTPLATSTPQATPLPPIPTVNRAPVNAEPPKNEPSSTPQRAPEPTYTAPAPVPEPIRTYREPAPAKRYSDPAPPAIAPTSVKRTSNGGYQYKLEIPFTGDQSLEAAQKAVPDAYLRPDGKIQLGAVGNQAEAKARIDALKKQGLEAEVKKR